MLFGSDCNDDMLRDVTGVKRGDTVGVRPRWIKGPCKAFGLRAKPGSSLTLLTTRLAERCTPYQGWHCQVVGDDIVTRQQKALSGRDFYRPDAWVARLLPVLSAQLSKRFRISSRYADADNRCR